MRRIDAFDTANAERLADQLSRFQDNAERDLATKALVDAFTDWSLSGSVRAVYGKVHRVNTNAGAISVTLPSISLETVGVRVGVLLAGANSVTLAPVESAATIDGAATETLSVAGLYQYEHDGQNWYAVAQVLAVVAASQLRPVRVVSASRSNLADDYLYTLVFDSASDIVYTVEQDSTVNVPEGAEQRMVRWGTGKVTVVQGAGATVQKAETLELRLRYSPAILWKLQGAWLFGGDTLLT